MFILASMFSTLSAETIKARVISSDLGRSIPGANVYVLNNHSEGTTTNHEGFFELNISDLNSQIHISSIGFKTEIIVLNSNNKNLDLGIIKLQPQQIDLQEVKIIASIAEDRKTPVSVSNIQAEQIQQKLGDQTFPEIMKMVPGVYATRSGGGSGDARVSLRGFKQENVELLLNGVPITSVENGLVYWNNWIGLADATQMIQVQKGIGASKVALNSIGGTINIITKSTEAQKGGSIQHAFTDYGNHKTTLRLSTGLMDNGWSLTFLGSKTKGNGYVDATYVDGYAYFLSASKQFGKNHKLILTALGNPEYHGQRNSMLTQNQVDQYGIKHNTEWGYLNGELNNASENFYFKPHFSINHYWKISDKTFIANSAYYSYGTGGGKWAESFNYGPSAFSYRNGLGQINWDGIVQNNRNNSGEYTLANGEIVNGYSNTIQTNYIATHVWTGLLSTIEHQYNENIKLIAGFHGRFFKSKVQEQVRDLLGGNFWIDTYAWSLAGVAGRNQIKRVGDVTNVDNGAMVNHLNTFAQIEYETEQIHAFIAGSISNTWYQREDRYNYIDNIKSEMIQKLSYDFKAGINYNIDELSNIYFNTAYYSKAPYFKFIFGNYTNVASLNINNERIFSSELGYGYKTEKSRLKVNAYYTNWQDISFLSYEYIQLQDNSSTRALVTGLNALHKGIEFEFTHKLSSEFNLGFIASFGNWKWKNDVEADLFNDNNVKVGTTNVYADGLYVGDAPQTQLGISANYQILEKLNIKVDWTYNDRLFADFDPSNRNDASDRSQSFQLPSYSITDIHINHEFDLFDLPAYFGISCFNVFNKTHILRGMDGSSHNLDSFQGFWGFERTFNFSFKLIF